MTPDTFLPWLKRAKAFDRRAYHTGTSAQEAPRVLVDVDEVPTPFRVSALAWKAYKAGLVLLFQRRLASHKFEYIAVRTYRRATDELFLELVGA